MTKAATIRTDVEQMWAAGETLTAIAERLNIPEARVARIVDHIEPTHDLPAILPDLGPGNGYHPYDTDRVAALALRTDWTPVRFRAIERDDDAPIKRRVAAKHGTESGYRAHNRRGEQACDPCREALRESRRAAWRRNKALKASA